MERYSDDDQRRTEDDGYREGERRSVGTSDQGEGRPNDVRSKGGEESQERKDRKRRSGSRERRKKKKRSRDRDRKRRSRDRDRSRGSRSRRRRSRSRSGGRRRGRRSRSPSYSPGYYRRLQDSKNDAKPSGRMETQRRLAREPKKFWDGFQWVVQQPNAQEGQSASQAALSQTRKDRRLYVGNLPPGITMDQLRDFLNAAMEACGGVPEGQKEAVLSVWIAGPDAKYSFVEFTTTDCATVAIGLNGINCMGFPLKISRPTNYSATIPGPPPADQIALLQQLGGDNASQAAQAALMAANTTQQPDTQALLAAAMGQIPIQQPPPPI